MESSDHHTEPVLEKRFKRRIIMESDTSTSCHEWTSLTGERKGKVLKVQIHLTLVTFIIDVHCVYQLLPSKMKDIPLLSALLPTVVKLWEVLCAVSQITCHQMTSFRCWHTESYKDLYSILSNKSSPQNAIPPKGKFG